MQLNFPGYSFKLKTESGMEMIWDEIRKKWVAFTPEENVRQHTLRYLTTQKNYPSSLIEVEKQVYLNGLAKRCDIVVNNPNARPVMIVECKAPSVSLSQQTLDQAVRYNMSLNVPCLMLTNGIKHIVISFSGNNSPVFLKEIPGYDFFREKE